MRKIIVFEGDETTYLGRNGRGRCIGIEVFKAIPAYEEVWISPINSKKSIARCEIIIPVKDIPEIIKALQEIQEDNDANNIKSSQ